MKVAIACDHGGFELKQEILRFTQRHECWIRRFRKYDSCAVDYPDYAFKVSESVAAGQFDRGILICGTGIGISIAANKVKGIRCALVHDLFSAKATREHNDSNVLAMGGRVIGPGLAREIVSVWLTTEFMGAHHTARIEKNLEVWKRLRDPVLRISFYL